MTLDTLRTLYIPYNRHFDRVLHLLPNGAPHLMLRLTRSTLLIHFVVFALRALPKTTRLFVSFPMFRPINCRGGYLPNAFLVNRVLHHYERF